MTRVRTDNVFGTLTDNPLTNVATTMNSAGLANLAVVSSAEAIIILDPNRVNGAPEIVVVTAHTGSATSATIQRGQFGTTARQHPSGTFWVHGPLTGNASSFVTAADDQGDFVPMNAWESWSPTFTNFTLGNGTVTAAFIRVGRKITFYLKVVLGTTSSMGTSPTYSLPVTAASRYTSGTKDVYGEIHIHDSGTANHGGSSLIISTTAGGLFVWNTSSTYITINSVTGTVPMTWTTGDSFTVYGTYEAAS